MWWWMLGCSEVAFRTLESAPGWELEVQWEAGKDGLLAAAVPLDAQRGSRVLLSSLTDLDNDPHGKVWEAYSSEGELLGELRPQGESDLLVGGLSSDAQATFLDLEELMVVDAPEREPSVLVELPSSGHPVLPDLVMVDGAPQLVRGPRRFDASTGEPLAATFDAYVPDDPDAPERAGHADRSLVLDLDQDGQLEWVVAGYEDIRSEIDPDPQRAPSWVRLHELDGSLRLVCAEGELAPGGGVKLAITQLDEDVGGEIVAMLGQDVVLCDSDGSLLSRFPLGFGGSNPQLGVADLDGDGPVEVVVAADQTLAVFDTLGAERWRHAPPAPEDEDSNIFLSFTAADLDGDGPRELVVQDRARLWIFDAHGQQLVQGEVQRRAIWHRSEPVVADLDGDGAVELLLSTAHGVTVIAPTDRPWTMSGPTEPSSWAPLQYAGSRAQSGGPRLATEPFWTTPGASWGVR
jgi:hypothetical protein